MIVDLIEFLKMITSQQYIELAKEFGLRLYHAFGNVYSDHYTAEEYEKKYGSSDHEASDIVVPDKFCSKNYRFCAFGYREKASGKKWKDGSLIVYQNGGFDGRWTNNVEDARKLINEVLKIRRRANIDERKQKIKEL